jgi:hypothetical protein
MELEEMELSGLGATSGMGGMMPGGMGLMGPPPMQFGAPLMYM